jgi:hypothetical protein
MDELGNIEANVSSFMDELGLVLSVAFHPTAPQLGQGRENVAVGTEKTALLCYRSSIIKKFKIDKNPLSPSVLASLFGDLEKEREGGMD